MHLKEIKIKSKYARKIFLTLTSDREGRLRGVCPPQG
jgi:hypothetical protein